MCYIINNVLFDINSIKDYLVFLMVFIKLGLMNVIFLMGVIVLIFIFWFRKDVLLIDIFILVLFSGSFVFYLFWLVVKLIVKVRSEKVCVLIMLDEKINKVISVYRYKNIDIEYESVEFLENEKEFIVMLLMCVMDVRDWLWIFFCLSVIFFLWLLIMFFEWLVVFLFF